ncbi:MULTISPECIES: GNAT family N-acetyltransferase [Shewanella]|uniref:N-acetyltransferase n=1 Tax=Shewanella marisflavi TaxID=260364 RepID=A0AAC9U0N3_9GAMM|nr:MULTISPECIES: GNAT family protein [Shewanella]ASJ96346.1 N-acetyltransferase [Shewanella marisflavi]QDF74874.1 GNAT family N-acetyltransferase [Shewanella marisflavi]
MLELYTDNLRIRSLTPDDWQDFLSVHQDEQQNRHVRAPQSEPVIRDKFAERLMPWRYESGAWLTLVIEEIATGEFIGFTGFYTVDVSLGQVEVGYMLSRNGQGRGYATESLKAVIDWACLQYEVHKFIALCSNDNLASVRVLEKCGFVHEGTLRHNFRLNHVWVDDCYFGLLASERGDSPH